MIRSFCLLQAPKYVLEYLKDCSLL
jgi:hypothetical protein